MSCKLLGKESDFTAMEASVVFLDTAAAADADDAAKFSLRQVIEHEHADGVGLGWRGWTDTLRFLWHDMPMR